MAIHNPKAYNYYIYYQGMYTLTELHPKGNSIYAIYINAFVFYLYKLILVPQRNTIVGLYLSRLVRGWLHCVLLYSIYLTAVIIYISADSFPLQTTTTFTSQQTELPRSRGRFAFTR